MAKRDFNKTNVEIFGNTYTINADVPVEYIKKLARYVDNKMEEINSSDSSYDAVKIAILAALNIADEFHQLKEMKVGIDGELEERTRSLITLLDEGLIGEILSGSSKPE